MAEDNNLSNSLFPSYPQMLWINNVDRDSKNSHIHNTRLYNSNKLSISINKQSIKRERKTPENWAKDILEVWKNVTGDYPKDRGRQRAYLPTSIYLYILKRTQDATGTLRSALRFGWNLRMPRTDEFYYRGRLTMEKLRYKILDQYWENEKDNENKKKLFVLRGQIGKIDDSVRSETAVEEARAERAHKHRGSYPQKSW